MQKRTTHNLLKILLRCEKLYQAQTAAVVLYYDLMAFKELLRGAADEKRLSSIQREA